MRKELEEQAIAKIGQWEARVLQGDPVWADKVIESLLEASSTFDISINPGEIDELYEETHGLFDQAKRISGVETIFGFKNGQLCQIVHKFTNSERTEELIYIDIDNLDYLEENDLPVLQQFAARLGFNPKKAVRVWAGEEDGEKYEAFAVRK